MRQKRILVTGGAGFLGSHLCENLLTFGYDVICLDNFFTGNKQNIYHLLDKSNFELLRHDVTLPIYLEVDEIFNLACPASPIFYQLDPIQTTKVNVLGAINMLGLAKRVKAKILQASTSEVYGDPEEHPQKETYWGRVNPIGPRSCYDEAKRFGEAAVGTNKGIDRFTKNMLFDEKIGGTIHMAIGMSIPETGGKNESAVHWDMLADMSDGGEIYADGELIYENAEFII